jgi:hypothetical protein
LEQPVLRNQKEIQITTGPACGNTKPRRVDIVRAFLERLNLKALTPEAVAQTDGNEGLPRMTLGRGNQNSIAVMITFKKTITGGHDHPDIA